MVVTDNSILPPIHRLDSDELIVATGSSTTLTVDIADTAELQPPVLLIST